MRKTISIILILMLSFLLSCGGGDGKTKITLYTSVDENSMREIEAKFEELHPNIDLYTFRLGTSQIIARVNAEEKAGNINADLIWTADPAYFEKLKQRDLILPYLAPLPEEILPCFVDTSEYYVGARVLSIGLMYNTNLIPEEDAPKDWEDLLDPKWKDQIVHANPLYSGAATATAAAITQKYGTDFYEKLSENGTVVIKGHSGAASKVASGEYKVGVGLDYTVRQMMANGSPIKFVYPESGSVSWGSPIAIFKATEYRKEAKQFIDFVVSLEGQKFLAKEHIVSVNSAVASPNGAPPVKEIMDNSLPVNWQELVDDRKGVTKEFMKIMMEQ